MKPHHPIPGPDSQPGISLAALLSLRIVQILFCGFLGGAYVALLIFLKNLIH